MTLPSAPNSISSLQIRNEFYGTTVNGVAYGTTDSNLYNLGYYRGKWYYTAPTNGTLVQFSTGTIDMNTFRGKGSNCACDCDCACACDCGNGNA